MSNKVILLKDTDELQQKFLQLVHIGIKLRKAQKHYTTNYLIPAKENKIYWELQMDEFLNQLNIKEDHQQLQQLQVTIQKSES
jgi:hypothetical protein